MPDFIFFIEMGKRNHEVNLQKFLNMEYSKIYVGDNLRTRKICKNHMQTVENPQSCLDSIRTQYLQHTH